VKMQMHENSLFAILLRSPWWLSLLIAAATAVASRWMLMKFEMPELYAIFVALPFLVISGVSGWRQLRAPSAEQAATRLAALRELPWDAFAAALESAWQKQGYGVTRSSAAGADLELSKAGRTSLVAAKRWKVARAGVEPLRELDAARRKAQASECIYVAAGELSDNAVAFAAQKGIRVLQGTELAALLK
jgi:restriction system protein